MFGFFKRKKVEPKVEIITIPHTFITNPPAKELALANAEKLRLENIEKEKQYKIEQKAKFIDSIKYWELELDSTIRNEIQYGRTAYRMVINGLYDKKIKNGYDGKIFLAQCLAARKFRKRGFKVSLKCQKYRDLPYVVYAGNFTPEELNARKIDMYSHTLTISWE